MTTPWTRDHIYEILKRFNESPTDPLYQRKIASMIYHMNLRQTEDEQQAGQTTESNGIGFNATDAPIMSSFNEQLQTRQHLTIRQLQVAAKILRKYAGQLVQIANEQQPQPQEVN